MKLHTTNSFINKHTYVYTFVLSLAPIHVSSDTQQRRTEALFLALKLFFDTIKFNNACPLYSHFYCLFPFQLKQSIISRLLS
jgi:hypothetical protein